LATRTTVSFFIGDVKIWDTRFVHEGNLSVKAMAHCVLFSVGVIFRFPTSIIRMNFCFERTVNGAGVKRQASSAFTMIETILSLAILAMVMSGLIYGYEETNRTSEWCSMSMAAQSYASEGAESARAADWRPRDWPVTSGYETMDELSILGHELRQHHQCKC